MNILIADDHSLIIDGFTSVIRNGLPDSRIFSATDQADLFRVLDSESVDILFQDVKFGKTDARDFIKNIIARYPGLKIIVISTLGDTFTVESLLKQGIHGYILKSDPSEEIMKAVCAINEGRIFTSATIKGYIHARSLSKSTEGIRLTPREKEVLLLILQEKSTREIAEEIFLSEKTIENHRANLFIKFDVKNLAGLVKKAIREGFG